jgi:hypothetical protein
MGSRKIIFKALELLFIFLLAQENEPKEGHPGKFPGASFGQPLVN